MQARIELLEAQVAGLQAEVRELKVLLGVEEEGFELVQTPSAVPERSSVEPRPAVGRAVARSSQVSQSSPSQVYPLQGLEPTGSSSRQHGESVQSLPRSERDSACREIGLWLLRSLSGEHRGSSGRDRLPQGSRFWLVLRDYEGNALKPPRVYTSYPPVKALTKRGSSLGSSVLVGLPTRADLDVVIGAAQLAAPTFY